MDLGVIELIFATILRTPNSIVQSLLCVCVLELVLNKPPKK